MHSAIRKCVSVCLVQQQACDWLVSIAWPITGLLLDQTHTYAFSDHAVATLHQDHYLQLRALSQVPALARAGGCPAASPVSESRGNQSWSPQSWSCRRRRDPGRQRWCHCRPADTNSIISGWWTISPLVRSDKYFVSFSTCNPTACSHWLTQSQKEADIYYLFIIGWHTIYFSSYWLNILDLSLLHMSSVRWM